MYYKSPVIEKSPGGGDNCLACEAVEGAIVHDRSGDLARLRGAKRQALHEEAVERLVRHEK